MLIGPGGFFLLIQVENMQGINKSSYKLSKGRKVTKRRRLTDLDWVSVCDAAVPRGTNTVLFFCLLFFFIKENK